MEDAPLSAPFPFAAPRGTPAFGVRVLVVDDDQDVLAVLARALERDGHAVSTASSLAEARDTVLVGIDLLVLDLGLPDGSGLELCRELRHEESAVPILILTARTQVDLRVEGLDAGADDYLTKPFALAELRARVRALGRRGPVSRSFFHTYHDVTLDFAGRRAQRANREVPVTAREWAILELLATRAGRITTRGDLLDIVWGDASESAGNSLEVLVARLRKKFGAEIIKTLRGEGYSLSGSTQAGVSA
jgi:two-component system OmpR family response regulator